MLKKLRTSGFTLVELLVTMVIMAILIGQGISMYKDWQVRTKVRLAAETLLSGLTLAQSKAVSLNSATMFSLVTNLGGSCALSNTASSWVVSQDSPANACNSTPSDTVAPRLVQSKQGAEGGAAATINAKNAALTSATQVGFSGMGRLALGNITGTSTPWNHITRIDITYPAYGNCLSDTTPGPVRCLRILITPGGAARLCDPSITVSTDVRFC